MIKKLQSLGPGLLFAGAAIGVSHLVQSTRAGADFGFGLLWALFLINLIKYPFFQFGPRYAQATGKSLLDGYEKLGRGFLIAYFVLTLATMFTIQTAVTIVTAGLASSLFALEFKMEVWCIIITLICTAILLIGKFKVLDKLMKVIIITLTISTLLAVFFAFSNNTAPVELTQEFPTDSLAIAFLIAFMGWMPAPLDISIWHSLWEVEKHQEKKTQKIKLFDFNTGYFTTIVLGIAFISLGALIMYPSGETFSPKGGEFANQLINLYQKNLGGNFAILIGIAAFTTMFSTTLTTLDASPRALEKTTTLLFAKNNTYKYWMVILILGTILILTSLLSEMGLLIKTATILSFLTAPFYAIANYIVITSKHTPKDAQPNMAMKIFSLTSIVLLLAFSIWYLTTL